jgi:hypothetical protein
VGLVLVKETFIERSAWLSLTGGSWRQQRPATTFKPLGKSAIAAGHRHHSRDCSDSPVVLLGVQFWQARRASPAYAEGDF